MRPTRRTVFGAILRYCIAFHDIVFNQYADVFDVVLHDSYLIRSALCTCASHSTMRWSCCHLSFGRGAHEPYTTMQCNALQCTTMHYNSLQCNTMHYNALQCNTMHYNALHYNTIPNVTPYLWEEIKTMLCSILPYDYAVYIYVCRCIYTWMYVCSAL